MTIHSTAIVDPSAKIGKDVTIGPYAVIGPDVILGDRCRILPHTTIEHTELGEECVVYPQASLGLEPQHMLYKGEKSKVIVGPRCVFRESVTVHRGTPFAQSETRIGSDGYFMALSHIAHDCVIGNKVIMVNNAQLAGHVDVGDGAYISGFVGVHQFVRIGECAIISGGTRLGMDVAPYCIAQGDRAILRGLNLVGMKRFGVPKDSLRRVKEAYKTVFLRGYRLEEALTQEALQVNDPHVKKFKEFFSDSKRGYSRPSYDEPEKKEEVLA